MGIIRTVLAIVMTLTLAAAPAMAANPRALHAAAAPADCAHHEHGLALPEKPLPAADHCNGMTDCGLCCVTLAGIGVATLSRDAGMGIAVQPVRFSGPSLSWLTAPPLRPPRV